MYHLIVAISVELSVFLLLTTRQKNKYYPREQLRILLDFLGHRNVVFVGLAMTFATWMASLHFSGHWDSSSRCRH